MASIKAGVGPVMGCEEVMMDMKRMRKLLLLASWRRQAGHSVSLQDTTIRPKPDRHAFCKNLAVLESSRGL
jgi:hypothetical protein